MRMVDVYSVFVISISNTILVGVYENNKLTNTYEAKGKTSEVLPWIFNNSLKKYNIKNIYYVNGPGSYMAIKVAYIFLKTLSIVNGIELKAADGFCFNKNSPIKALGKKYFIKDKNGNINVDFIDEAEKINDFELPEILNENLFSINSLPTYNLPAVN